MRTAPVIPVLATLLVLPVVAAHSPNGHANCSTVHEDEAVATPLVALYLDEDLVLWRETNGWPGLQTHEHTCTVKLGKDSYRVVVEPDERVLSV